MGLLETDAEDVRDAIKKWRPVSYRTEKEFEAELYEYLHTAFPSAIFHRQYCRAKTRADLYVEFDDGARVAVEVKCGLSERGDYHRLLGQVYEYLYEWEAEVVVVLCGNTDPALGKLTHEYVETISGALDRLAYLVVVRSAAVASP